MQPFLIKMQIRWLCIISGIFLLFAVFDLPYDYFIFLRWIIFISALIVGWRFYQSEIKGWALVFGAVAFLFNPIIPIYLTKASWIPIDFVSALLFFLAAYSYKRSGLKREP